MGFPPKKRWGWVNSPIFSEWDGHRWSYGYGWKLFIGFWIHPRWMVSRIYEPSTVWWWTGWWQLKSVWFSPRKLGKIPTHFNEHIFQRGWFNHQLEIDEVVGMFLAVCVFCLLVFLVLRVFVFHPPQKKKMLGIFRPGELIKLKRNAWRWQGRWSCKIERSPQFLSCSHPRIQ